MSYYVARILLLHLDEFKLCDIPSDVSFITLSGLQPVSRGDDYAVRFKTECGPNDRQAGGHRMSAPGDVDKAIELCGCYRHVCGLDAFVRDGVGPIFMRVGGVGAVRMPAPLGQRVHDRLVGPGPVVIEIDGASRACWTMLTGAVGHHLWDVATFGMLSAVETRLVPDGYEIRLPTPRDGRFRWLVMPKDGYRPSPDHVIDAVRVCRGER
ncbi:hypothetical protein AB0L63_19400 [Nocardia sp. NPDC051990]|uniref:hypothetical protein n=1 Tax=Nocardia sp. NPDC051990 TaxID=3155285 RepID=UPI003419758C